MSRVPVFADPPFGILESVGKRDLVTLLNEVDLCLGPELLHLRILSEVADENPVVISAP